MAVSSPGIAKGGSFRWDFELDGLNSSLSSHLTVCLQPPPHHHLLFSPPVPQARLHAAGFQHWATSRRLRTIVTRRLLQFLILTHPPDMVTRTLHEHTSLLSLPPPSFLFYSTPLLFFIRLLLPFFFFSSLICFLSRRWFVRVFRYSKPHTRGQLGEGRTPQWLR